METEKTILEQISQKEAELKVKCDKATELAESVIHQVRMEAEQTIDAADGEGRRLSEEYQVQEMEALKQKIVEIKKIGEEAAASIETVGRDNLTKAVDHLVKVVLG